MLPPRLSATTIRRAPSKDRPHLSLLASRGRLLCSVKMVPLADIPVELVQQSLGGTQSKLPSFDQARDEFTTPEYFKGR